MIKNGKIFRFSAYLSSIICIIVIWTIVSRIIASPLILPVPEVVLSALIRLLPSRFFWKAVIFSLFRVIAAFIFAIITGSLCGYFIARYKGFKYFMEIPLAIISATPVIAVILLALFWFTSDWVPVFAAVLMSFPVITRGISAGFSEKNEELDLMAEVYSFSDYQYLRFVQLPVCKPFFFSSAQSAFGLCWKVVAASEVLCLPAYGFGSLMQKSQVHLETEGVIAVTVMLVLISFVLQKIMTILLKLWGSYGK